MLYLRQVVRDVYRHRAAYTMGTICSWGGMVYGFDTGLIGGVLTEHSFLKSFNLDPTSSGYASTKGNIVIVLLAGCILGAFCSFYIPTRFGRRPALLLGGVVFLIGSIVQVLCKVSSFQSAGAAMTQLFIGRFVGGAGLGLLSAVVPTYISECAPREIRGRLAGMFQLFNVTGIMLSYWINYGANKNIKPDTDSSIWRLAFGMQLVPGVILVLGMLTQPESPRWLVEKGKIEAACRSLARLRNAPSIDDPSVQAIVAEINMDLQSREKLSLIEMVRESVGDRKTFYRVSMAFIMMFWQQWTFTNAINYYSPTIFNSLGLSGVQGGLFATGVYGCVKVVCTCLGLMFCMEQVGRKICLIVGGLGQGVCMFYLAIYLALRPEGSPIVPASYVAIVCVYLFAVFYSFGWGSVPWAVSAEFAPNHLRSLAMSAGLVSQWVFNTCITKITPILLQDIKYKTFVIAGICCVLMSVYVAIFLPESKGLELEQVAQIFEGSIVRRAIADLRLKNQLHKRRQVDLATAAALHVDVSALGEGGAAGGGHQAAAQWEKAGSELEKRGTEGEKEVTEIEGQASIDKTFGKDGPEQTRIEDALPRV